MDVRYIILNMIWLTYIYIYIYVPRKSYHIWNAPGRQVRSAEGWGLFALIWAKQIIIGKEVADNSVGPTSGNDGRPARQT
jgi:hypothetical protein